MVRNGKSGGADPRLAQQQSFTWTRFGLLFLNGIVRVPGFTCFIRSIAVLAPTRTLAFDKKFRLHVLSGWIAFHLCL
jgi:hypothetical protein